MISTPSSGSLRAWELKSWNFPVTLTLLMPVHVFDYLLVFYSSIEWIWVQVWLQNFDTQIPCRNTQIINFMWRLDVYYLKAGQVYLICIRNVGSMKTIYKHVLKILPFILCCSQFIEISAEKCKNIALNPWLRHQVHHG